MDYNPNIKTIFANLLITPWFRWLIFAVSLVLTIYVYIQDPIRYSEKKMVFGISYKLFNFLLEIITVLAAFATFLSLWYTIPFTDQFPTLWFIPVVVVTFAYITQLHLDAEPVVATEGKLNAPPEYIIPRRYRIILVWALLIINVITFLQNMVYAGISADFRTTILHQFILNRFGGLNPGNILKFIFSWLGTITVALTLYQLYDVTNMQACTYDLPQSWNF
jgi:hypothetical protein